MDEVHDLSAEGGRFLRQEEIRMSLGTIVLIIVLIVLFGGGGGYYYTRRR